MIIVWHDNNMRRISRSFNNIHFSKYSHPLYSTLLCKAEPCFHLINTKKKIPFIPLLRQLKFKCHITMQLTIKLSTINLSITTSTWQLKTSWLYVLVMSRTRLNVNPHSTLAWMSKNSLLKAGTKSEI